MQQGKKQIDWVCMNSRKQEVGLKYGWVQNDSFKKKNKGTYLEYDYKKIQVKGSCFTI